jgi:hypothetical protein
VENNNAAIQAKAALIRAGQTGEAGCLSIIQDSETVLVFTSGSMILNIYKDGIEMPELKLNEILEFATGHLWLAEAKPPKVAMAVEIVGLTSRRLPRSSTNAKTAKLVSVLPSQTPKPKKKIPSFYLVAVQGTRKKFILEKPSTVIGRDKGCDIVLSDRSISRRHCILQLVVRGLFFRDLASSNGVYINGSISREGFLLHGDQFSLGDITFEVCIEAKTAHLPRAR